MWAAWNWRIAAGILQIATLLPVFLLVDHARGECLIAGVTRDQDDATVSVPLAEA